MVVSTLAHLAGLAQLAGWATDATPALAQTPAPETPEIINTTGIVDFIATKVTPILLAILGVIFISRAGKGEMSKVLTSSAIAIVGLAFIVGAGALFFLGEGLVDLIFGTN